MIPRIGEQWPRSVLRPSRHAHLWVDCSAAPLRRGVRRLVEHPWRRRLGRRERRSGHSRPPHGTDVGRLPERQLRLPDVRLRGHLLVGAVHDELRPGRLPADLPGQRLVHDEVHRGRLRDVLRQRTVHGGLRAGELQHVVPRRRDVPRELRGRRLPDRVRVRIDVRCLVPRRGLQASVRGRGGLLVHRVSERRGLHVHRRGVLEVRLTRRDPTGRSASISHARMTVPASDSVQQAAHSARGVQLSAYPILEHEARDPK